MTDYRQIIIERRKSWDAQAKAEEESLLGMRNVIAEQLAEINAMYNSVDGLLVFGPDDVFMINNSGFRLSKNLSQDRLEYTAEYGLEEGVHWRLWYLDLNPRSYSFDSIKNDFINWLAERVNVDGI